MFASIIYEATLVNINHKFNSRRTMAAAAEEEAEAEESVGLLCAPSVPLKSLFLLVLYCSSVN